MKTFAIGDVHGGYRSLKQVLERSKFDYDNDKLICLGDFADGWTETFECFEEIFKIKNLVYVRGNHDQWLKDWLKQGKQPIVWTMQGGRNTIDSYMKHDPKEWKRHLEFLKKTKQWYVDDKNRVFVHGGVSMNGLPVEKCDKTFLMWDRELWDNRHSDFSIYPYDEAYVGHTSIWRFSHLPLTFNKVTFLDLGGGWEGKLTMMDIDSKEVFQSDIVLELYPECRGRN